MARPSPMRSPTYRKAWIALLQKYYAMCERRGIVANPAMDVGFCDFIHRAHARTIGRHRNGNSRVRREVQELYRPGPRP